MSYVRIINWQQTELSISLFYFYLYLYIDNISMAIIYCIYALRNPLMADDRHVDCFSIDI